jgi:hypothetical protein
MTGYAMVSKEFYQGHTPEHPFSLVNQQLSGTCTQMEALDRLVVLSPGGLLEYQKVQSQQLWLEMRPKQEKSNEYERQEEIDRHLDEIFDTYQELPFEIEENEEFLDCRDDLPIYETRQVPLNLNSLYPTFTIVNCSIEPTETNFDTPVTDSTGEK